MERISSSFRTNNELDWKKRARRGSKVSSKGANGILLLSTLSSNAEHGSLHKYRHGRVDFLIKVESRNATYGASEGTGVERSIQTGTIPPIPI